MTALRLGGTTAAWRGGLMAVDTRTWQPSKKGCCWRQLGCYQRWHAVTGTCPPGRNCCVHQLYATKRMGIDYHYR